MVALKRITFRLEDEMLEMIQTESRKRQMKPSRFIRECINLRVQPNSQQKTPAA